MAWQRVTFRILPQLNKLNVFLHFFEDDAYILSKDVFQTLDNAFLELFKKQFSDAPTEIIAPITKEKLIDVPLVEKVEEVLPVVEPIIEKVKEILPVVESIIEKIEEILPIDVPLVEKIEEIKIPKEEEKVTEKLVEKPFVPFFSVEQLKRIFGKKD
jgi:hypothetical protein